MDQKYNIKVSPTRWAKPSKYWIKMRTFGLRHTHRGEYVGSVSGKRKLAKIRNFCESKKLRFMIDNEYGSRDNQYRTTYFRHTKPIRGKYWCAYCGILLPAHEITVDHIYPVAKVSKSPALQKRLRKKGIDNINDANNLVGACMTCNQKKSAKMGRWIVRGRLGKKRWFWYVRMVIRTVIVLAALAVILQSSYELYQAINSVGGIITF